MRAIIKVANDEDIAATMFPAVKSVMATSSVERRRSPAAITVETGELSDTERA